ncbi:MAG: hypothetical protein JJE30_11685 [Desulfuromonadales bacterium]|nr:hypothetical protein [Desulfuromonadales bacterium]
MRFFLMFIILVAAVTSAYAIEPAQGQFNFKPQIGVAEVVSDGEGCLTIVDSSLKLNEEISIVTLQKPQKVIKAKIKSKTSNSCSKNPEVPSDASFYIFKIKKNEAENMTPGIAVAGFTGSFNVVKGKVHADLDNNGNFESFRLCTSNEGLHLTVWAGEPLKSKRLWHEYYYLGYDVQPNCTKKDYAE